MLFLRRIIWLALFVLLCAAAVSHAMQLQPPQKLAQQQAARLLTKPAATAKLKPATRHTPVSTHIHVPKRAKRSVTTDIIRGHASRASIIRSHRTTMGEHSGSVTLDVEIGKPIVSSASVTIANAPEGMKFSRLRWPGLARMPNGMLLRAADRGAEFPLLQCTFAIPANATAITPILKPTRSTVLGPLHFAPTLSKATAERTYTANASIPSIAVGKPKTFRSLRMVTVTIPLVVNNGTGYAALEDFTLGIDFKLSEAQPQLQQPSTDPMFAALNAHMVINVADLPAFAVPLRTESAAARSKSFHTASIQQSSDTVTGWIDTNAASVRLAVTRDGLYRVNASELELSSFSLQNSNWTAHNLRCFNHGIEVPIWIDSDAAGHITGIEFYGEHLYGFPLPQAQEIYVYPDDYIEAPRSRSEYYNVATDTNVYWLTASGGDTLPLRYTGIQPTSAGALNIPSGTVLLHHEKDLVYYPGDPVQDQTYTWNMTEWVTGERFVWEWMHGTQDQGANPSNTHFVDTFFINQLPRDTAGNVATVSFLFRGATKWGTAVHTLRAAVNGVQGFQPNFSGYSYDSLVMTVPVSKLRVGANVVTVDAGTVGDNTDQFYLDYYSVSVPEALAPSTDTGIAKGQWLFTLTPGSQKFQLQISDNAAHLYNLSDRTRILGAFIDSTGTLNPHYAAATTASLLRCDNIQAWNTKAAGVGTWEILNPQNQTDYLIITHPSFLRAAQMLATSRANEGMKTKVVTTDEVFNAFDYGSNEAEAIRRYVTYAYNHYAGAPVSFVTLLGNATWDPKHNVAGDSGISFIPTYGNPVSDYYFTIPALDSSLDRLPLTLISRVPVSSEAQAEAYLSKLQEYENAVPAAWDQHALFLAGGLTVPEHNGFDNTVRTEFMQPLALPPTDMQDTIIDRTDFSSGVDATHVGDIENLLNQGQSLMYFDGHGATFTTDIAFPDPSILQNKGLYPLLMTLTCHTGAFAEPTLTTINQSYVEVPEAGSVQAYGTTGLGDITYDDPFTLVWIGLMRSFDSTHDTTRPENINQLQLLSAAKISQIGIAAGGEATTTHNETLQNSMLGDGATGFALKPQPELAVYSNEVHAYPHGDTVPETDLVLSDSTFTIRALIHNYGYAASRPVVVKLTDRTPNGFQTALFDTLPGILTSAYASATFGLTAQSIGMHSISIVIDPNHQFPESYLGDDSASIQLRVNGISTTPFYPYEGSRAMCDLGPTVHFIVLTPPASNANDQVEIQLDTTATFSNVMLDRKTDVGTEYDVTFDLPLPAAPVPASTVYWWRTRVVRTNGDTTTWQPATFSTGAAPRAEFSYSSPDQLTSTVINGLSINSRGFLSLLQQDTLRLEAISLGLMDSEVGQSSTPYAQVNLNGHTYWQDSGTYNGVAFRSGFVILIWTPDGTQIDTDYQFEMEYPQIGDSIFETTMARAFDSVIAGIPAGRRVMVLTVGSVDFSQFFFPQTKSAMQTLGSKQGMGPMAYDGSYALIGTKGSSPGAAKEAFAPVASNGAHAYDTIITAGTSGLAETPYTAVAKDYGSLTWSGDAIASGNDIVFSVLGARRDGSGVDVVDTFRASKGNAFSLSNIDPRLYDQLAVQMAFTRTANTAQSPALSGIALQYDPAPELSFAGDSIACTPKVTNTGGTIIATYSPSTLTCTPGDSVLVLLVRQTQGKTDTPSIHLLPLIPGHGSITISDTLSTQNELGAVSLTAIVNPNEAENEQLLFNNTINGSYSLVRDTMAPVGEILFADPTDRIDQHVSDCGYVSANSIIHIQLLSSNPLRDTSASSISANFVDESNTSLVFPVSAANPNGFNVQFKSFPSGPMQGLLTIIPSVPFAAGQWLMMAFIRDASGNTDTVEQCFQVSDINGLEEVMNYPNPFKETTDFTFVLKSDAPANLKIVVYTIAGRKIRTLTPAALHAGFNAVEWDGRDERGNEVANGTYLYRVIINGTNGDSVSQAVSQTAVRAR